MDKEKLKKYTGYAGLGFVSGLFCLIVISGGVNIKNFPIEILLLTILGGLLGGVIAKKWWGALVGGFILFGLMVILGFCVWAYMW